MSTGFRRRLSLPGLLASCIVVAAPTLCLAGVLTHLCACEGVSAECGCSDACCEVCTHDGCENDPCQTRLTRQAGTRYEFDVTLAGLGGKLFLGPVLTTAIPTFPSRHGGYSTLGPPGIRKRIPYHPSDIPFLL